MKGFAKQIVLLLYYSKHQWYGEACPRIYDETPDILVYVGERSLPHSRVVALRKRQYCLEQQEKK